MHRVVRLAVCTPVRWPSVCVGSGGWGWGQKAAKFILRGREGEMKSSGASLSGRQFTLKMHIFVFGLVLFNKLETCSEFDVCEASSKAKKVIDYVPFSSPLAVSSGRLYDLSAFLLSYYVHVRALVCFHVTVCAKNEKMN